MNDPRPETFYTDYLDAAEIHIAACKELGKRLDAKHYLFENESDKVKVIQEMYYLSGYIIECMLCYALGTFIDENIERDISKINLLRDFKESVQGEVITFRRSFAENDHAYTEKLRLLRLNRMKTGGIPFIDIKYSLPEDYHSNLKVKFEDLFKNWHPHCRYKLREELRQTIQEKTNGDDTPNAYVIYQYVSFLIRFANLIKGRYSYRTQ